MWILIFLSASALAAPPLPSPSPSPSASPSASPISRPSPVAEAVQPAAPQAPTVVIPDARIIIDIGKDGVHFSPERVRVKPGQTVEVTFRNTATHDDDHYSNWTLVKPGSVSSVLSLGLKSGADSGDPDFETNTLVKTRTIAPGEATITLFQAPLRAGSYPYINTAPGVLKGLWGILEVAKPKFAG